MERLILKTWTKDKNQRLKLFTDMRKAIAYEQQNETFYIVHKINDISRLRQEAKKEQKKT